MLTDDRMTDPAGRPSPPTAWQRFRKTAGPIGVVLLLLIKFLGKLKFIVVPVLKFLPLVLKTGGTMFLSIWLYALAYGVWFGVGFVFLLLVHECGHLVAARRVGLKVGAPVFIPFMGAVIALKEAPRNAWIEAQVGIGGPILGSVGAGACHLIFESTGTPIFRELAHVGYLLNLFNLTPLGFLDGGRIVTALSPWLWLVGFLVILGFVVTSPNILLVLILAFSIPRLFSLFRRRSETERRYFEVTPAQRWAMAAMYFGLIALLVMGMQGTFVPHDAMTP